MRNELPTIGGAKGDGKQWHINAETGYPLETFCERRFILPDHDGVANYLAQELDRLNLCEECERGWERRNTMVTELNSMFNLPSARLKATAPVEFDEWLMLDHLSTI